MYAVMHIFFILATMAVLPFVFLCCHSDKMYKEKTDRQQGHIYRICPKEKPVKKPELPKTPVKEHEPEPEPEVQKMPLQDWLKLNADYLLRYLEPKASSIYGGEKTGDLLFISNEMIGNADPEEIRDWLSEQFCVGPIRNDENGLYAQIEDVSQI